MNHIMNLTFKILMCLSILIISSCDSSSSSPTGAGGSSSGVCGTIVGQWAGTTESQNYSESCPDALNDTSDESIVTQGWIFNNDLTYEQINTGNVTTGSYTCDATTSIVTLQPTGSSGSSFVAATSATGLTMTNINTVSASCTMTAVENYVTGVAQEGEDNQCTMTFNGDASDVNNPNFEQNFQNDLVASFQSSGSQLTAEQIEIIDYGVVGRSEELFVDFVFSASDSGESVEDLLVQVQTITEVGTYSVEISIDNYDGVCVIDTDECDVCGGDGVLDNCGNCDNNPSNDCEQDCAGTWGGTATIDDCGNCGGSGPSVACSNGTTVCDAAQCPGECVNNLSGVYWHSSSYSAEYPDNDECPDDVAINFDDEIDPYDPISSELFYKSRGFLLGDDGHILHLTGGYDMGMYATFNGELPVEGHYNCTETSLTMSIIDDMGPNMMPSINIYGDYSISGSTMTYTTTITDSTAYYLNEYVMPDCFPTITYTLEAHQVGGCDDLVGLWDGQDYNSSPLEGGGSADCGGGEDWLQIDLFFDDNGMFGVGDNLYDDISGGMSGMGYLNQIGVYTCEGNDIIFSQNPFSSIIYSELDSASEFEASYSTMDDGSVHFEIDIENEMYGGGICNYDIYFDSTPEPEEEIEFVGDACYDNLSNGAWHHVLDVTTYPEGCGYTDQEMPADAYWVFSDSNLEIYQGGLYEYQPQALEMECNDEPFMFETCYDDLCNYDDYVQTYTVTSYVPGQSMMTETSFEYSTMNNDCNPIMISSFEWVDVAGGDWDESVDWFDIDLSCLNDCPYLDYAPDIDTDGFTAFCNWFADYNFDNCNSTCNDDVNNLLFIQGVV